MNYEDFLNRLGILTEESGSSGLTLSPEVEADIDKFDISDSMKKGIKGMVIGVYSGKLNGDTKKILDKVYTIKSVDNEGRVLQAVGGKKDTSSTANVNNTKKVWDEEITEDDIEKKRKEVEKNKEEEEKKLKGIVSYVDAHASGYVEGFIFEAVIWLFLKKFDPKADFDGISTAPGTNDPIADLLFHSGEYTFPTQCKWHTLKEKEALSKSNTNFNTPYKDWDGAILNQDKTVYTVIGGNLYNTKILPASIKAIKDFKDIGDISSKVFNKQNSKTQPMDKNSKKRYTLNQKEDTLRLARKGSNIGLYVFDQGKNQKLNITNSFWENEDNLEKDPEVVKILTKLCGSGPINRKFSISNDKLNFLLKEFKKLYNDNGGKNHIVNKHVDNMKFNFNEKKNIKKSKRKREKEIKDFIKNKKLPAMEPKRIAEDRTFSNENDFIEAVKKAKNDLVNWGNLHCDSFELYINNKRTTINNFETDLKSMINANSSKEFKINLYLNANLHKNKKRQLISLVNSFPKVNKENEDKYKYGKNTFFPIKATTFTLKKNSSVKTHFNY